MNTTVIITGTGTGIGQALAKKIADSGYQVIGIGRRLPLLQKTKEHNPTRIEIIQADITQSTEREKVAKKISKIGGIIYLVHNAASAEPLCLLKNISLDDWRQHQAINVEAPLFLTQKLLPYLKNGRILHISSGLAHYPLLGAGGYCMSKAALYMLYQCLREELKEFNIAVGSAMPGVVDTPMQEVIRNKDKEQLPVIDGFIRFKQKNELISPEIVADFFSWLLFKTDDGEFSSKDWDIADSDHHSYWLKNKNIQWNWNL